MINGITITFSPTSAWVPDLTFSDWDLRRTTTEDLKAWIASRTGYPESRQQLCYFGKVLGDIPFPNVSLHDQNVKDGTTIQLSIKNGNDHVLWKSARELMWNEPWLSWEQAKSKVKSQTTTKQVTFKQEKEQVTFKQEQHQKTHSFLLH